MLEVLMSSPTLDYSIFDKFDFERQPVGVKFLTTKPESLEKLDKILDFCEMLVEAQEGRTFYRIPDRAEAIRFGIALAGPGDVVIVLGKGHEQSMCFGELEYPWDDRLAMRAALAEYLGIPGPDMPYLPTQEPKTKRES